MKGWEKLTYKTKAGTTLRLFKSEAHAKAVEQLIQEAKEEVAREIILGGRCEEEFEKDEIWLHLDHFLRMKKKYLTSKKDKKKK